MSITIEQNGNTRLIQNDDGTLAVANNGKTVNLFWLDGTSGFSKSKFGSPNDWEIVAAEEKEGKYYLETLNSDPDYWQNYQVFTFDSNGKNCTIIQNPNGGTYLSTNQFSQYSWIENPSSQSSTVASDKLTGTSKVADTLTFSRSPQFGAATTDRITNFNPKEKDKLLIQLSQFGSDAAGTFKIAKNTKALNKALGTSVDFVYLKSSGELYYNENGAAAGFGNGGVFAVLEGNPAIKASSIGFI
jgi:hypothetical protein